MTWRRAVSRLDLAWARAASRSSDRVLRLWIVATVQEQTDVHVVREAWDEIKQQPQGSIIQGLAYVIHVLTEVKGDLVRAVDSLLDFDDLCVRDEATTKKKVTVLP